MKKTTLNRRLRKTFDYMYELLDKEEKLMEEKHNHNIYLETMILCELKKTTILIYSLILTL